MTKHKIKIKNNSGNIEVIAGKAYEIIKNGGLVLLPDGVGYGLVGNSNDSIKRIYNLKKRPESKPLTHYMSLKYINDIVSVSNKDFWLIKNISSQFPCCFIVSYKKCSYFEKLDDLTLKQSTKNGTVALYFNEEDLLVQKIISLAQKDGIALIVTSANISGSGNAYKVDDVAEIILDNVDMVIFDSRPCKYYKEASIKKNKLGATIINLADKRILRKGIFHKEIVSFLGECP